MIFQRISGIVIILFGLNLMGVLKINFLNISKHINTNTSDLGFFKSLVFGAAFTFGWTPCIGAFLGSALLLAANSETVVGGMGLLLIFSLGLGVPFMITAILFNKLSGALQFIKKNYNKVNKISGVILIITGLLLFNIFGFYLSIFG